VELAGSGHVSETSYHATVNELQGLALAGYGPFAQVSWFALLAEHGPAPLFALARLGDHSLVLPLAERQGGLEALTNWYAFTWRDLATGGARRKDLLRQIACDLRKRASRVTLDKLPGEDGIADSLQAAFRGAGWVTEFVRSDVNHVLAVNGRSYGEYLAARPGTLRTTLKRKAKKVQIELFDKFQDDAWSNYEQVYGQSWKPSEGDPSLLRRFAEAEGLAGRLRLGLARHDGVVVAAQFWTVQDGTAWIHKLAHLESAKPLSAGTTLSAALFEQVIDRDRVGFIDFGTGDDGYKRDWMEAVRTRYRLTCWRADAPRNWPAIARHGLRTLVSRRHAG
jgi:hypothetical protein